MDKKKNGMFGRIQRVVRSIPPGKVSSYGAVARAAGFPGAARQVVWALRQGRDLPWQRVVAAGGRIALPGEAGFDQRLRLEAEGVLFSGNRVRMKESEFIFPSSRGGSRPGSREKRSSKGAHPVRRSLRQKDESRRQPRKPPRDRSS